MTLPAFFSPETRVEPLDKLTVWKALRLFSLYRIILAGFLLVLVLSGQLPTPFGVFNPVLFDVTVCLYLSVAMLVLLLIRFHHLTFRRQVFSQIMLDLVFFASMMFASGGVSSGIGMLMVMSVAAGSLLVMGRVAFLFAAVATLVVLIIEISLLINQQDSGLKTNFTQAGLLGAVLFATAALAHHLAIRLRASEALAAQRGIDLASLAKLNESIVHRMRSGIIVLDDRGLIRLANAATARLLDTTSIPDLTPLAVVSLELNDALIEWRLGDQPTHLLRSPSRKTDVQASFTHLKDEVHSDILIFLEDAADMRQKAQQLKLASLGGLTANIAHEIRNPLGAISHAGQLLSEADYLEDADQRLLQMINEHSLRMNQIIENILQLGRRQDAIQESVALTPWLEKFTEEFRLQKKLSEQDLKFHVEPADISITMDQSQLHQVLWNLSENALRYSVADKEQVGIEIQGRLDPVSQRPYLDVIDNGPGIAEDNAERVFEPFFTDRKDGTGLGLYIASELCESNHAQLTLHNNSSQGCCFRLTFAHPDKQLHIE